jgi:rare lipoprotein A
MSCAHRTLVAFALLSTLCACSTTTRQVAKRHHLVDADYPAPVITPQGTEIGVSSWYGPGFHGQLTASGERYDQDAMTAAHRTLPLGTWVQVRNLTNGRLATVRVNDRGPYKVGRVLDLSYAAAQQLAMVGPGTTEVEIRLVDPRYRQWPTIRYCVQVGAFRSRSEADAKGTTIARAGERAYLKKTGRSDFPYSVRVGPYDKRSEALAAVDRLSSLGLSTLLVEEDPPASVYAAGTEPRLPSPDRIARQ